MITLRQSLKQIVSATEWQPLVVIVPAMLAMPAYVLTHGQDFLARCLVGVLLAGGLVGSVWGLWQAGLRRYSSATS